MAWHEKSRITESQHGQGWQGPLGVTQSNPMPKQGHPAQAAQHCVQAGLEYLQRRRLHNLPGQPGPGLRHPQREEVLPRVQSELTLAPRCFTNLDYLCVDVLHVVLVPNDPSASGRGGRQICWFIGRQHLFCKEYLDLGLETERRGRVFPLLGIRRLGLGELRRLFGADGAVKLGRFGPGAPLLAKGHPFRTELLGSLWLFPLLKRGMYFKSGGSVSAVLARQVWLIYLFPSKPSVLEGTCFCRSLAERWGLMPGLLPAAPPESSLLSSPLLPPQRLVFLRKVPRMPWVSVGFSLAHCKSPSAAGWGGWGSPVPTHWCPRALSLPLRPFRRVLAASTLPASLWDRLKTLGPQGRAVGMVFAATT